MANENKNQDEINANDPKDGADNGNISAKAAGSESLGSRRKNKLCNCFISIVISFFVSKRF